MTTSTLQGFPIDPTPPTAGQTLVLTGGVYVPTTPAGGGISLLTYAESSAYLAAAGSPGAEDDVLTTPQFTPTKTSILVIVDTGGALWNPSGAFTEANLHVDLNGTIVATRRFQAKSSTIGILITSIFKVTVVPSSNYILKIRSSVTGSAIQFAPDTNMTYSVTVME